MNNELRYDFFTAGALEDKCSGWSVVRVDDSTGKEIVCHWGSHHDSTIAESSLNAIDCAISQINSAEWHKCYVNIHHNNIEFQEILQLLHKKEYLKKIANQNLLWKNICNLLSNLDFSYVEFMYHSSDSTSVGYNVAFKKARAVAHKAKMHKVLVYKTTCEMYASSKCLDTPQCHLFTDGSCESSKTRAPGGWAVVSLSKPELYEQNQQTKSTELFNTVAIGHYGHTTNGEMELIAVYRALIYANAQSNSKHKVVIHCDADWIVRGYNEWMYSWHKKNYTKTKYATVWKSIYLLRDEKRIEVRWVRSHSKDNSFTTMGNNAADKSANCARFYRKKEIEKIN